ncbi:NAD(P)H-dependent FMN reductase [Dinghuibacter silviterrae]|uniref:NAD(P)H-dependent FMN reductase n=2 Tax=Dinghuibacter silviterrae TaxID=1539049 RepID=A0A4R8DHL1_9BACT|nr:NAD(P)H-dependent FMN reductase [Dinghuibacter silviterrae]
MARLGGATWKVTLFDGLAGLPAFNPDLDPPSSVQDFLMLMAQADGILICTPEYAMGVPGSLKNAIDWTVGVSAFSGKPTALVTASLAGQKGHASLMETLRVIEARVTDETQLVIGHAQTKIDVASVITDPDTLERVTQLVRAFDDMLWHASS